jgi:hypothetical protein
MQKEKLQKFKYEKIKVPANPVAQKLCFSDWHCVLQ